ncbi:hypothetical protein AgCh_034952 [Apium graveolens]
MCMVNVKEFDHHCLALGNCIGRRNRVLFVALLVGFILLEAKSDTPISDVSRSSNRKKFTILSIASYWLNQIKLSESVAKHSISIAFFKVAYEAGCEAIYGVVAPCPTWYDFSSQNLHSIEAFQEE